MVVLGGGGLFYRSEVPLWSARWPLCGDSRHPHYEAFGPARPGRARLGMTLEPLLGSTAINTRPSASFVVTAFSYRGTSLIRNTPSVGPSNSRMPRDLWRP